MQTIEEAIAGFRVKHQEAVQFAPANSNVIEMQCSIHGVYSSRILYKMVRSKCPQCEEEYLAIKKAQEAIEQEERRKEFVRSLLSGAKIPIKHADNRFETYKPRTARQKQGLQVAKRYAEEFPQFSERGACLGLFGNLGVGKTHLAASIADYVIRNHGVHTIFTRIPIITLEIKESFNKKNNEAETEKTIFERYANVPLLVLDEVGATTLTDYERGIVINLITARYENRLPCIYTTNLSGAPLADYLSARAVDRITGFNHFMVSLDGSTTRAIDPDTIGGKA